MHVADKGEKLFKQETLTAIKNLRQHVSAGCLSDIPPGGGTNRNERLHEHIKHYFNRSRIGILLAYSLLHMIIHVHNSSETVKGKHIIRPVAASSCKLDQTAATTVKPIGIIPKFHSPHPEQQGYDHWEINLSEETIDMDIILPVYHTSLKKYQVLEGLLKEKLVQASKIVYSFQEFQGKMTLNLEDHRTTEIDLENYGLTIVPVNPDGNCFFAAISVNIKFNQNFHSEKYCEINKCENLCMKLREAFVSEITGDRHSMYENFVEINEGMNYMDEATKFL